MKLIHLSDLHLGKKVNAFSMLEDQTIILKQILDIIDTEQPDGVMIAGDVYDRSVPAVEAVTLFDDFLVGLARRQIPVFAISGNHDSPERLAFGNRLMADTGIYIASAYDGRVDPVVLEDSYGKVMIYMLPFIKPLHVRRFYPEAEITSYTDALAWAIRQMEINPAQRNVLIAHQFVTGASRSDSEDISVGGTDNVDAAVFEDFDYVALGHLHGPQNAGSVRIRYCGSPLKYSFSEAGHTKSVTVVELGEKGRLDVRVIPLVPARDLVEIRGSYNELTLRSFYEDTHFREDYLHITLTDEMDIPDAVLKLRVIYPHLMKLDYDNLRTRSCQRITGDQEAHRQSPLTLFESFYQKQNGLSLSEEQREYMDDLIRQIWEESK